LRVSLGDISHADLDRQLTKLHGTPGEYNHRLQNAKTFFTWAQKKRYISPPWSAYPLIAAKLLHGSN
jgi:hypothetical protein